MNVYLDSNVLFDALFARTPFAKDAWQLLNLATEGKIELSVSTLTIVNAVYVAKRYDIPLADVRRSLLEMHHFISFVDLTGDNVVSQLGGEWKDFEDAVQYGCAIGDFSDYIVTRNATDFGLSSIPVVSPKTMLERLGVDSAGDRNGVEA